MNIEQLVQDFKQSTKHGEYSPLILEPTSGTGERLTFAIAGKFDGDYDIYRILDKKKLNCLYGKKTAESLDHFISVTIEDFNQHINSKGTLYNWEPLFNGIFIGKIHETRAHSLSDLINQGLQTYASLGNIYDNENEIESKQQQWIQQIKHTIEEKNKKYLEHFNKPFYLPNQKTAIRVGFLHYQYTAKFISITPNNYEHSKAQILDLSELKKTLYYTSDKYEFVASVTKQTQEQINGMSNKSKEGFYNKLSDIKTICSNYDIGFTQIDTPPDIYNHISELVPLQ